MYNESILKKVNFSDGGDNMQANMLKGKLTESGMTQEQAASRIGISLSRFNAKLNETRGAEFSLGEVLAMKNILNLSPEQVDQIFFT